MDVRPKCVALLLLYHTGAALEIFVPSTHQVTMGSNALIPCSYTVPKPPVNPKFFAAFWRFQGNEILSLDDEVRTINSRYSLNVEKALNGTVDLSISKIVISDAGVYTCSVLYSPMLKQKEINVYIKVLPAAPHLEISDNDVSLNEESVLRGSITGFYPLDIDIRWFRGAEMLSNVFMDKPKRNSDGTYSMESTVIITPTEEDRERTFSCRVQHESLKEPVWKEFQLIYTDKNEASENSILHIIIPVILTVVLIVVIILAIYFIRKKRKSADLEVGEIKVPKLTHGQGATLECTLYNYTPTEHSVLWLQKRIDINTFIAVGNDWRRRTTTEPEGKRNHKSCLILSPVTEDDRGTKYICRVRVSSSGETIERSTGWLFVDESDFDTKKREKIKQAEEGSDGLCSVNESIPGEKKPKIPVNKKMTDRSEEGSTGEDAEKLRKEKEENNKTSQIIDHLLIEHETDQFMEGSARDDEEELNKEKEHDRSLIIHAINRRRSKEEPVKKKFKKNKEGTSQVIDMSFKEQEMRNTSGENSTMEDEELKEKKDNEEPKHLIDKPLQEQEVNKPEEGSSGGEEKDLDKEQNVSTKTPQPINNQETFVKSSSRKDKEQLNKERKEEEVKRETNEEEVKRETNEEEASPFIKNRSEVNSMELRSVTKGGLCSAKESPQEDNEETSLLS